MRIKFRPLSGKVRSFGWLTENGDRFRPGKGGPDPPLPAAAPAGLLRRSPGRGPLTETGYLSPISPAFISRFLPFSRVFAAEGPRTVMGRASRQTARFGGFYRDFGQIPPFRKVPRRGGGGRLTETGYRFADFRRELVRARVSARFRRFLQAAARRAGRGSSHAPIVPQGTPARASRNCPRDKPISATGLTGTVHGTIRNRQPQHLVPTVRILPIQQAFFAFFPAAFLSCRYCRYCKYCSCQTGGAAAFQAAPPVFAASRDGKFPRGRGNPFSGAGKHAIISNIRDAARERGPFPPPRPRAILITGIRREYL